MARKPPPKHSQFKKGQSGNPEGARKHNPMLKVLKNLTVESYREIIELVLTSNVAAIQVIAQDPKSPAIKVAVCTAFLKAIKNGDYTVIEQIAQRIVGKIPDELNINANLKGAVAIATIDKDKLRAAMDELQKEV